MPINGLPFYAQGRKWKIAAGAACATHGEQGKIFPARLEKRRKHEVRRYDHGGGKPQRNGTNFLLSLADYMEMVVKACDDSAVDMADTINQLYGTKEKKCEWSDLYFAGNKSVHASFCTGETQLSVFLNDGEWSFDTERCSKDCLDVLRIYNLV